MSHKPTYLGLKGQALVYAVTICSGLSFLLFGFDLAFMGGVVGTTQFTDTFGMNSPSMVGFLVSSYEVGCLLGGVFMFVLGDPFGRRTINMAGAVTISLGALLQASSFGIPQFLVGRIVAGFGLGMMTTVVPVWLVECARPTSRGRMMGIQLSNLILGLILASWLDYGLQNYDSSFRWRFPCAFQAVLCAVLLGLLPFLPESPRWLVKAGHLAKARHSLAGLRGGEEEDPEVVEEIFEIGNSVELVRSQHKEGSWGDCFRDGGCSGLGRVVVAMLANAGQQLTGSNVLSSFGTYVFQTSLGMSDHEALLVNGGLQVWFFVSSIGAWWAVDYVGRRKLFLFGSTGMTLCMALSALFIGLGESQLGYGALVVFYLFYTFFTIGWQANMWIYPSELLPLHLRQRGAALCMVVQWLVTFIVVETTPPLINGIGFKSFILYGALNAIFIPIVYFFFPETVGLSLEAVNLLFADRGDGTRPSFTESVRESSNKEHRRQLQIQLRDTAMAGMDEKHYSVSQVEEVQP